MSPQRLDEILRRYRVTKARYAYLKAEIITLRRWLEICQSQSVNDRISLSQAITGMPHGSGVGDPTGRLAADIASGEVSTFVKQVQADLKVANEELKKLQPEITIVEIVMTGLGDREREVLVLKIVDARDWKDTVEQMNGMHNNSYSKRTLQRLLDRALERAYEIVR